MKSTRRATTTRAHDARRMLDALVTLIAVLRSWDPASPDLLIAERSLRAAAAVLVPVPPHPPEPEPEPEPALPLE